MGWVGGGGGVPTDYLVAPLGCDNITAIEAFSFIYSFYCFVGRMTQLLLRAVEDVDASIFDIYYMGGLIHFDGGDQRAYDR